VSDNPVYGRRYEAKSHAASMTLKRAARQRRKAILNKTDHEEITQLS